MKEKWFIYTVLVGLIPFFARLIIFLSLKNKDWYLLFDAIDFILLALVINITNINELEGNKIVEENWKIKVVGSSIIVIFLCAVLFAQSIQTTISPTLYNKNTVLLCAVFISIASFIFGYSVFNRLSAIKGGK